MSNLYDWLDTYELRELAEAYDRLGSSRYRNRRWFAEWCKVVAACAGDSA